MEKIWVASNTGKPVHLVDTSAIVDGDYVRICITQEMADKGIGVQVPNNSFITGYLQQGLLKEIKEVSKAKADNTKFVNQKKAEEKAKLEEQAKWNEANRQAVDAARKAYEEKIEQIKKGRLK